MYALASTTVFPKDFFSFPSTFALWVNLFHKTPTYRAYEFHIPIFRLEKTLHCSSPQIPNPYYYGEYLLILKRCGEIFVKVVWDRDNHYQ